MTATTLDTVPARKEVTTASVDVWAIDFASALQAGESLASVAASLRTTSSIPGAAVVGFVTATAIVGTVADVAWTGAVLSVGSTYALHTQATLNTGAVVVLLTTVACVG